MSWFICFCLWTQIFHFQLSLMDLWIYWWKSFTFFLLAILLLKLSYIIGLSFDSFNTKLSIPFITPPCYLPIHSPLFPWKFVVNPKNSNKLKQPKLLHIFSLRDSLKLFHFNPLKCMIEKQKELDIKMKYTFYFNMKIF